MAFCSGCGTDVGAGVTFCPKCGKAQSGSAPPPPVGLGPTAGTGLDENVAGLLSYAMWWVTGLIFFLIDQRPFVRFHAMQSMIAFGALFVLHFVLQWVFVWGGLFGGIFALGLFSLLGGVIWLLALVAWVLCMVKAYQGQRFKLPVIGDLAENFSK